MPRKVTSMSGYRELTLSEDPECARSVHAENGPSGGSEGVPGSTGDSLLTN
jgi:hypothetical protein